MSDLKKTEKPKSTTPEPEIHTNHTNRDWNSGYYQGDQGGYHD